MSKKVLVIDDETDMLNVVKHCLSKAGYTVFTCDNGRNAWDSILQNRPDLLLLDVMLPGMDGYSLQIKLAENDFTKEIPIIVFTALEPSKTLFQKFPQVKGFMTKPFKTEALLQSVENTIGKAN